MESNNPVHVDKFKRILSEMNEAKNQKKITYMLGYSNFTFELWMVLHKQDCNSSFNHRKFYLNPICKAFGEQFVNLGAYKQKTAFNRCLKRLNLDDVKNAVLRAEKITDLNGNNGNTLQQYKGYHYYQDNPALSIHEVIKMILDECGIFK